MDLLFNWVFFNALSVCKAVQPSGVRMRGRTLTFSFNCYSLSQGEGRKGKSALLLLQFWVRIKYCFPAHSTASRQAASESSISSSATVFFLNLMPFTHQTPRPLLCASQQKIVVSSISSSSCLLRWAPKYHGSLELLAGMSAEDAGQGKTALWRLLPCCLPCGSLHMLASM